MIAGLLSFQFCFAAAVGIAVGLFLSTSGCGHCSSIPSIEQGNEDLHEEQICTKRNKVQGLEGRKMWVQYYFKTVMYTDRELIMIILEPWILVRSRFSRSLVKILSLCPMTTNLWPGCSTEKEWRSREILVGRDEKNVSEKGKSKWADVAVIDFYLVAIT